MPTRRFSIAKIVAGILGAASILPAAGHSLCRPKLNVTDVQFSEMIPPTLERKWTATVWVDASSCAPNATGAFQLGISRLKEIGEEIDFREQFIWWAPSVQITVNFAADEAVERYWIENVTPCKCAG